MKASGCRRREAGGELRLGVFVNAFVLNFVIRVKIVRVRVVDSGRRVLEAVAVGDEQELLLSSDQLSPCSTAGYRSSDWPSHPAPAWRSFAVDSNATEFSSGREGILRHVARVMVFSVFDLSSAWTSIASLRKKPSRARDLGRRRTRRQSSPCR